MLLSAALCGCATYSPVIDEGAGIGNYDADLRECQRLAQQRDVVSGAASGAVVGALFGALLGAAIGGRDMIGAGARAGAAGGLTGGAARSLAEQQLIVARCMSRRGYAVVGP
jgi:hypothetical protein